jgi:phosphoadenosine phosphosulfate reductase
MPPWRMILLGWFEEEVVVSKLVSRSNPAPVPSGRSPTSSGHTARREYVNRVPTYRNNDEIAHGIRLLFKEEFDLSDMYDLMKDSIEQIRSVWRQGDYPLYVCFSGGKDSQVLLEMVRESGVPHRVAYNVTSVDPPEVVRFIRDFYPECEFAYPPLGMDKLIRERGMLPTRKHAFCCDFLKERIGPNNHIHVVGVRREESARRRRLWSAPTNTRQGRSQSQMVLAPLLEWPSDLIWLYIKTRKLPYCKLYDNGWARIGCIGCPMISGKKRLEQFLQYPRIHTRWRRAADACWERIKERKSRGVYKGTIQNEWTDSESYWQWWMSL